MGNDRGDARPRYDIEAGAGARLIALLESGGERGRLERGLDYERSGKLQSLRIGLDRAGWRVVRAEVEGRDRPSYIARLAFPPFDPEKDLEILPGSWEELRSGCSCPDRRGPCKHRAALVYFLARLLDSDPKLILFLRGLESEADPESASPSSRAGLSSGEGASSPWSFRLSIRALRSRKRPGIEEGSIRAYSLRISLRAPSRASSRARIGFGHREPLFAAGSPGAKAAGRVFLLALTPFLPEIAELLHRERIVVPPEKLASFLGAASEPLSAPGVAVALPKSLRKELDPRLVLAARAKQSLNLNPALGLEALLDYDWRIAIGDECVDIEEFAALARSGRALVAFREGFALVEPREAARLLARARSAPRPFPLTLIAARLAGEARFSADAEEILASLLAEREVGLPHSLRADLRPYQERGFRWIWSKLAPGFGCLLADDMGLGKTVQALAVLAKLAEEGLLGEGALVIAPAALLDNWEREIGRFAPSLSVRRYHGSSRDPGPGADILLTTYQTTARDQEKLSDRVFSLLIVDEAQLLKNAATRCARAIGHLRAERRLALSGTPVENHLEDLRAIFDLVLPGYLGTKAEFARKWRYPIEVERDGRAAEGLRRVTAPFLLRRLKTDGAIVADLPPKLVIDEYAHLVPSQAALYQCVVSRGLEEAARVEAEGDSAKRLALILRLLSSLKQICDHPRIYDRESPAEAALSGKCLLLLAILEGILSGEERVLVFSHYVMALKLLDEIIRKELGEKPLLYHGGMSGSERDGAVRAFQAESAPRILLVSLKAGGLGLNLTTASRVVHFDLWFNPAVEDQATDRAHRIGQRREVFVHRLLTRDSFEEKIDALIKAKREIARLGVAEGETWLGRLPTEELRELFSQN